MMQMGLALVSFACNLNGLFCMIERSVRPVLARSSGYQ